MIIPKGYIRIFTSWLRLIIKTIAFRSYTSIFSVLLRVFRHCQTIIGRKERFFQEPGLASSSQPVPVNQEKSTLAVPLFKLPPTTTSIATSLYSVAPVQSFDSITLTPTTPGQIKRYDTIKLQGDYTVYEVPKGPLDCSE
ncbi:hypothetical protein BDR07DRAFT_909057 [Suillus spraguei]|nr:hypothetical protein BDR07DRAFT_909057 [Suillus spraguei]